MGSLAYYLLLFAIAIPALFAHVKKPSAGWALAYLVLLIFVGLRHEVGSDWAGYLLLADLVRDYTIPELLKLGDPLFYFVLWTSVQLGLEVYGANLVTSAVFLAGVFAYCRRMPNPWLALYTALPFLIIVVGMSANRQAAAIGVTLYLLARWEKSSLSSRLILLAIATGFHASAMLFLVLFIIDSKLSLQRKILAMSVIVTAGGYLAATSISVERYANSYITDPNAIVAAGALQQILLNALPGMLLLMRRRPFMRHIPQSNFILPMAWFALVLVPVTFVYSVAAARISFYLFPVSISVLSSAPSLAKPGNRNMVRYLVVLYGAALLGAWLTFANNAYNHKPYGNWLFL